MTGYLLFFGRTPQLSRVELSSFFDDITTVSDSIVAVSDESCDIDGKTVAMESLLGILGGTTRIARMLDVVPQLTADVFARELENQEKQSMCFGISVFGNPVNIPGNLLGETKSLLEANGHHVRFLTPHEGSVVSAVAILKNHATEFVVLPHEKGYLIGKTVALSEFEQWSEHDYGRPYADAKSGMLPPKVARMAVNIACGRDGAAKQLLDPFCGMGTIVAEALTRGIHARGSDNDAVVVAKAQKNIQWSTQKLGQMFDSAAIRLCDAAHISDFVGRESLDAIVTEPYMGPTSLGERNVTDPEQIRNILKGLTKLYIGCLKEWHACLKPQGKIVIAIPQVVVGKRIFDVKKVIDRCEILGYTKVLGPLPYSRPQAIVKRQFYVLVKKSI